MVEQLALARRMIDAVYPDNLPPPGVDFARDDRGGALAYYSPGSETVHLGRADPGTGMPVLGADLFLSAEFQSPAELMHARQLMCGIFNVLPENVTEDMSRVYEVAHEVGHHLGWTHLLDEGQSDSTDVIARDVFARAPRVSEADRDRYHIDYRESPCEMVALENATYLIHKMLEKNLDAFGDIGHGWTSELLAERGAKCPVGLQMDDRQIWRVYRPEYVRPEFMAADMPLSGEPVAESTVLRPELIYQIEISRLMREALDDEPFPMTAWYNRSAVNSLGVEAVEARVVSVKTVTREAYGLLSDEERRVLGVDVEADDFDGLTAEEWAARFRSIAFLNDTSLQVWRDPEADLSKVLLKQMDEMGETGSITAPQAYLGKFIECHPLLYDYLEPTVDLARVCLSERERAFLEEAAQGASVTEVQEIVDYMESVAWIKEVRPYMKLSQVHEQQKGEGIFDRGGSPQQEVLDQAWSALPLPDKLRFSESGSVGREYMTDVSQVVHAQPGISLGEVDRLLNARRAGQPDVSDMYTVWLGWRAGLELLEEVALETPSTAVSDSGAGIEWSASQAAAVLNQSSEGDLSVDRIERLGEEQRREEQVSRFLRDVGRESGDVTMRSPAWHADLDVPGQVFQVIVVAEPDNRETPYFLAVPDDGLKPPHGFPLCAQALDGSAAAAVLAVVDAGLQTGQGGALFAEQTRANLNGFAAEDVLPVVVRCAAVDEMPSFAGDADPQRAARVAYAARMGGLSVEMTDQALTDTGLLELPALDISVPDELDAEWEL